MTGPILNYTTTVEVDRTVAEITKILVKHGASSVSVDYVKGVPTALSFVMATPRGPEPFRLPARVDRVATLMARLRKSGELQPRYATPEQAARVGWRIAKDWVEAQLALVASGMVDVDEVLMPYMVGAEGETWFEHYVEAKAIEQKR